MKILIYPPLEAEHLAQLQAAAGDATLVNAPDEATAIQAAGDADGMVGVITPPILAAAKQLRWLQTPMAGLENYMFPELVSSDLTMCNMAGIYSDIIADHVFMFILMFARGMHVHFRHQLQRTWEKDVPVIHLADQTLGVVGLGGIGSEVAKRGRGHAMRVIAVDAKRTDRPDYVDELWPQDRLDDLLAEADFLVLCVPQTPETVKLITAPQLARMKETAYLINISRGVVVDLDDLTAALQAGQIAGAGLDVFEVEPLPADHPLWGMENVLITPHMAGRSPHVVPRRIGVIADNLRRFVNGEPLHNIVDKSRWF